MNIKKILFISLCFAFCISLIIPEDASEIIKKLDRVLYPDSKIELQLIFEKKGKMDNEYKMISYSKNLNQKIIIRFTYPGSIVGNDMIFMEQNVWQFDKTSGRIMKIPSNLTFGGTGFSYGDVVRLNMSDNYNAEIKSETADTWILNLAAKERNAPYYRIELEVKKDLYYPVKGVCFGKNNQIIKYMNYSDVKDFNGNKKPSKITVVSPTEPDNASTMITVSETLKSYPDNIFNKNNLEMRQEENF